MFIRHAQHSLLLLTCLALLPWAGICAAEEEQRSWNLGLALGHGQRDNPLISGDEISINAVVDFSWYGEHLFFDNGDFGLTLKEHKQWSVNLVATFNNERNYYNYLSGNTLGLRSILDSNFGLTGTGEANGKPDSTGDDPNPPAGRPSDPPPEISGSPEFINANTELPDRDFALNSGIEFLHISPWGDIQAQLLTDISSTHNGQEAWVSWSKPWYTRNSEVALTLGLEWKSGNLVKYYYGVQADEAFNGRPEYQGGSGTNRFIRLSARHRLNDHWQLVGLVEREFLSSAIRNSPIVDQNSVDTVFAGLFYQF